MYEARENERSEEDREKGRAEILLPVSDLQCRSVSEVRRLHPVSINDVEKSDVCVDGRNDSIIACAGKDIGVKRNEEEGEKPTDDGAYAVNCSLGTEALQFVKHSGQRMKGELHLPRPAKSPIGVASFYLLFSSSSTSMIGISSFT